MLYVYDKTYYGYLTAIFQVYAERDDNPAFAPAGETAPTSLLGECRIHADAEKARRVEKGLRKLSPGLHHTVYYAWLSEEPGMDDTLYRFIAMGFAQKSNPAAMLYDKTAVRVSSAARKVGNESHRYLQFVRFLRAAEDCYIADIEPSYDILPLIADHFVKRFAVHNLIIRDRKRCKVMVWNTKKWYITDDPEIQRPPLPRDTQYEDLWRSYFKVLCIPHRRNLKLQAHFVPKRYRRYLTEMQHGGEAGTGYGELR